MKNKLKDIYRKSQSTVKQISINCGSFSVALPAASSYKHWCKLVALHWAALLLPHQPRAVRSGQSMLTQAVCRNWHSIFPFPNLTPHILCKTFSFLLLYPVLNILLQFLFYFHYPKRYILTAYTQSPQPSCSKCFKAPLTKSVKECMMILTTAHKKINSSALAAM